MGRTPLRELNRSVSSESFAVTEAQPWMALRPRISCSRVTVSESTPAPTMTSVPLPASPSDQSRHRLGIRSGGQDHTRAPQFLQRFRRNCGTSVHVFMGSQLFG